MQFPGDQWGESSQVQPFPIRRMHRAAAVHKKRRTREREREREREGKREPKRKKKVQWGDTESLILQGGVTRETRKSSLRIHLILAQELLFLLFI